VGSLADLDRPSRARSGRNKGTLDIVFANEARQIRSLGEHRRTRLLSRESFRSKVKGATLTGQKAINSAGMMEQPQFSIASISRQQRPGGQTVHSANKAALRLFGHSNWTTDLRPVDYVMNAVSTGQDRHRRLT